MIADSRGWRPDQRVVLSFCEGAVLTPEAIITRRAARKLAFFPARLAHGQPAMQRIGGFGAVQGKEFCRGPAEYYASS